MNNAEFECIQYISVNNALVLISVVSISDAVYIKQKLLNLKFILVETFHYLSCFCLFFGKEEFEFKIYINWVLYFLKHAPANQDTRTNYAMRLKVSIEKSHLFYYVIDFWLFWNFVGSL